jgi:hypothetical protein
VTVEELKKLLQAETAKRRELEIERKILKNEKEQLKRALEAAQIRLNMRRQLPRQTPETRALRRSLREAREARRRAELAAAPSWGSLMAFRPGPAMDDRVPQPGFTGE